MARASTWRTRLIECGSPAQCGRRPGQHGGTDTHEAARLRIERSAMAAEQPPEGPGRRPRQDWWIAAGLLALLLAVGLVVLCVKAPAPYGTGDAAKTAPKEGPSLL